VQNGKAIDALSAKAAASLRVHGEGDAVLEGIVRSVDEVVSEEARQFRVAFGVIGAIAAALFCIGPVAAALYEPRDLVMIVPLELILFGGLAALVRWRYGRNQDNSRAILTPRLARMAAPGARARLDDAGVTVAGAQAPWPELTIETVEFKTITVSEGPDYIVVESLTLKGSGGTMVLDRRLLAHGQEIVDRAWVKLRGGR